jgi:hypothetical protein
MRFRRRDTLVVGVALVLLPVIFAARPALAKGPSQGVITGPGLAHPITLKAWTSTTTGPGLGDVVMQSGFFIGTFGGNRAQGRLRERPAGSLGPRYTITYAMELSADTSSNIVQIVYPYAEPSPVTYIAPHQQFWDGNETRGAWFVAGLRFKQMLIDVGLPATPPMMAPSPAAGDARGAADSAPAGSPTMISLIVAAVLAFASAAFLARRRVDILHRHA